MPAKRAPQTEEQVVELERKRLKESPLYRKENAEYIDTRISSTVRQAADELQKTANTTPVSLTDTQRVISITIKYMEMCAEASTVPSVAGLSRALGISRRTFYDTLNRHSPAGASEWFQRVHDCFAELLSTASLRNEVNTISSIFLLKALYQYHETNELIVSQRQDAGLSFRSEEEQQAEIKRLMDRYGDIPED